MILLKMAASPSSPSPAYSHGYAMRSALRGLELISTQSTQSTAPQCHIVHDLSRPLTTLGLTYQQLFIYAFFIDSFAFSTADQLCSVVELRCRYMNGLAVTGWVW